MVLASGAFVSVGLGELIYGGEARALRVCPRYPPRFSASARIRFSRFITSFSPRPK